MWCPSHSSAWIALSQHIGHGRVQAEGRLRLTMERQGGVGLMWSLTVAGQRCRAWCEESAWCQWIAPLLPVPALAQIDKALLTPLALWSWQPLLGHLADEPGDGKTPLQIKPPTEGTLAEAWDPQLILVREDEAELALRLVDWPAQWLIEHSRSWKRLAGGTRVPPLAISVVAGWCHLADQTLETIGLGEGLRLSGPVDLWHGEAWLFQEQPLARVRFSNTQQAVVEAIMAEQSDWPPERGNAVQALSITVVAEIGQLWVPLEQLAALQVGEVLQGASLFEGAVRLKANGRYLGSGQLIEVGGHWIVQIDGWFNQQPLTLPQEGFGEALAVNGLPPSESEASIASMPPVDLSHQAPAVDALLPQAAVATGAVQEEALERAVETVEAVIEEEKKGEALMTKAAHEVVTTLDHDGEESSEEESAVEREEMMIVKQGIAAMSSAPGRVPEQYEQPLATTTVQSLPVVTAAEPAATPAVVMPPKPPRPPKALRSAMNSMAKAVAGRRKPGNPSTV